MRKREHKGVFVTLFFAAVFVILIGVILAQINIPQKPTLTVNNEIPRMEISLNGVILEEIYENGKEIKYLGNNVIFTDGDKKEDWIFSNYYFNIPVMANYYVAPGFALKAGVALNILSTAKIDGKDKNAGHDVKDWYKSTFFSIPVGASYEINDFVFDARYNFGVSKAAKGGDGSFNALTFTVGYKF